MSSLPDAAAAVNVGGGAAPQRTAWSIGYARFVEQQPLAACQSAAERAGWQTAARGEAAALRVEAAFAFGSDPDAALAAGVSR